MTMMTRTLLALSIPALTLGATLPAQAATAPAATAAAQLAHGYTVPSKASTLTQLRHLTVRPAGSMKGYTRDLFPHWRTARTYGWTGLPAACNARSAALMRDGSGVKTNARCTVTAGRWIDPYTAQIITSKTAIDIDHTVPLANSWVSGASTWTTTQRTKFANSPLELISVSGSANRAKGDKDPSAWKPANRAAWCLYAKRWVAIKATWHLSVTASEKSALTSMLGTCTR